MPNNLWEEIHTQGDNLRQVINHLYGPERGRLESAAAALRPELPIALIGIGSAGYLCTPSECFLSERGRYANAIHGSEALYTFLPALRQTNIIINSRSGESAEIVKLCQILVANQIPFMLLTNEPDSSAARLATHVVWSNSRKDQLVSINIVTGMMLTTLIASAAALGQLDTIRPELDALPELFDQALAAAASQKAALVDVFKTTRPIYLLYRGASKGAAYCGRLLLEEVARRPALAMDAGEFRHGPIEVVDDQFGALIFVPQGPVGDLSLALARDITSCGGRAVGLGTGPFAPADGLLNIALPLVSDYLFPILAMAPIQLLAFALADRQGYAPGTVRYISRVISDEAGIPNALS